MLLAAKHAKKSQDSEVTSGKKTKSAARIPTTKTEFSANWKLLSKTIQPQHPIRHRRPKSIVKMAQEGQHVEVVSKKPHTHIPKLFLNKFGFIDYTHYGHFKNGRTADELPDFCKKVTRIVAIDCEMVGVGPMKEDALARVSIVNEYGFCLLDSFVKPKAEVTDYRTEFSGVREEDLQTALTLNEAMSRVAELIKGKILVGHSVDKDLGVLLLFHPSHKLRDTARYFRKGGRSPSLKYLAEKHLKVEIQTGEHSSIQDAQATMKVYLLHRKAWEKSLEERNRHRHPR